MQLILGNYQQGHVFYPYIQEQLECKPVMMCKQGVVSMDGMNCLRVHGGLRGMAWSLHLELLEKIQGQNLEDMIISLVMKLQAPLMNKANENPGSSDNTWHKVIPNSWTRQWPASPHHLGNMYWRKTEDLGNGQGIYTLYAPQSPRTVYISIYINFMEFP